MLTKDLLKQEVTNSIPMSLIKLIENYSGDNVHQTLFITPDEKVDLGLAYNTINDLVNSEIDDLSLRAFGINKIGKLVWSEIISLWDEIEFNEIEDRKKVQFYESRNEYIIKLEAKIKSLESQLFDSDKKLYATQHYMEKITRENERLLEEARMAKGERNRDTTLKDLAESLETSGVNNCSNHLMGGDIVKSVLALYKLGGIL